MIGEQSPSFDNEEIAMCAGTRAFTAFTVATLVSLMFVSGAIAQGHVGLLTVSVGSGSNPTDVEEAEALIDRMTRDGQLVRQAAHGDNQLPGRYHEGFSQHFKGVPVYGASISKQTEGGTTVSIFGAIYTDIDINPNPSLSLGDAATLIEQRFGARALQGTQPLTILPTLDSGYALTYRVTAGNAVTYFVDAHGGQVLMEVDEKRSQSAVGRGRGVLGDVKKISVTRAGGSFEARDQLRPSAILTLNVRGSQQSLDRLVEHGIVRSSDVATDRDNNWTGVGGIVDTHVHMGWTYDYFFKRHSWSGLDGRHTALYGVRASSTVLPNNAFFAPPPFGPNGRGIVAFGTTRAGTPFTTLDTVAHELMHGVTHFGVSRRSPGGLVRVPEIALGPTSILLATGRANCSEVTWRGRPFLCDQGRFVLVADHGGAIHEALSDVFGTATEFFFQPAGSGPLAADYKMGEDIPELGPFRSLVNPKSLYVDQTRTVRYPDHFSRRLRFAVLRLGGNRLAIAPIVFFGSDFFVLSSDDSAGVHWNSTILSHAFYLAAVGGRNRTSGVTVRRANRGQIERVFFRAVTELLPGRVSLPQAANVVCQAAVDLFGHNGSATRAVDEALYAVGLRPAPAGRWCRGL